MSVLKILAYSKDLSGPKAPCSQMVSPQDKKKKLQNRFGPTSKAETGILAYTEQEIIWVYLRPNQFKASNRTCYLIT